MPSVYIKTLGCKVNTYDSNNLETQFRKLGYDLVSEPGTADISVVNTCSVTDNADKESRYLFRRYRRENPTSLLVATGCYAQTDSAEIAKMPEVDFIIPNEIKEQLVNIIHESFSEKQKGLPLTHNKLPGNLKPISRNRQGHFKTSLTEITADSDQTRAFLKIQDGCNGFCTYCLIPYARGASRSVPQDAVLKEIRRLIDQGIQEIVFTGIHIGDYGEDWGDFVEGKDKPFIQLLRTMMDWPDMVRFRISSLEPRELCEDMLKLAAARPDVFCDHFHLPLQSGHDRILKMMRRTYTSGEYAEKVAMAKSYLPNVHIGADVIPGFPGETAEEAQATIEFIKKTGLNALHVFPYSKRPNTAAERMPNHLPQDVVKRRAQELSELSKTLKHAFAARFLGQSVDVLWENTLDSQGRRVGKTSNYLDVVAHSSYQPATSTISSVKLKGFTENSRILGVPVQ